MCGLKVITLKSFKMLHMIPFRGVTHKVITHKLSERIVAFMIVTLEFSSIMHILRESLCFVSSIMLIILMVICNHDHDI